MNYTDLFNDLADAQARPRAAPAGSAVSLSEEQAKALAASFDRSATVCAGAGAGKTRLLVERAAALIAAGADPAKVAVVTFTRKAAKEISARLLTRFGDKSKVPVCATVHSLALSSLLKLGLPINVASEEDTLRVLAVLRGELPSEYAEYSDSELLLELNRCREEEQFLTTQGLIAWRFEELMQLEGLTDFTSLLSTALKLIKGLFDHILVDEAQDLSQLQLSFLKVCGNPRCRYWFIGDPDQAIYAFRGAHQDVMRELQSECEDQYVLSVNYRSTRKVVQHANNVIQFNAGRLPINWTAHRTDEGSVSVEHFRHGDDEVERVAHWLAQKPGRAALARTQALLEPLKQAGLSAFSVHESKGLEWPEVWVMGCEAALFPHPLCTRDEERRLFYVAMTRARDHLVMSYCASRAVRAKAEPRHPSPFLIETQAIAG